MQRTLIIAGIVVLAAIGIYGLTADNGVTDPNATPSASVSTTPGATPTSSNAAAARALQLFLMGRTKFAASDIVVSDVEEKEWPNSCLGLPLAGEVCAQAVTPGYRMKATIKGEVYYYRTNRAATLFRLER